MSKILSKVTEVDISKLVHLADEENVVKHPESEITLLEQNLKKFGQYRPIIIDENYKILAGNAVTMAMRNIGAKKIYAVQYNDLSEQDKKALILVDNYTSEMNFFRRQFAEEVALSLDLDEWDLGDLAIRDEDITEMFSAKPDAIPMPAMSNETGTTTQSAGEASTEASGEPQGEEETRGTEKMRKLGAFENEAGEKLKPNEVRCPNCDIILTV